LCTAEKTMNRVKIQSAEWKKIFDTCWSNRGFTSRIYKELKKLYTTIGRNKGFCWLSESTPCIAILISTSENPCSFLLWLILSLQQN
jgi:hypothetical protein